MLSFASEAAALIGRLLLSVLFLHEAWSKLAAYSAAVAYMQAFATELGCGVLILLGYQTRLAALVLAAFCVATAVLFHAKFGVRNELLHFAKDLAIAGGLFVLFAHGAGGWAIDAVRAGRKMDVAKPAF